jgi:hypothetical protein
LTGTATSRPIGFNSGESSLCNKKTAPFSGSQGGFYLAKQRYQTVTNALEG